MSAGQRPVFSRTAYFEIVFEIILKDTVRMMVTWLGIRKSMSDWYDVMLAGHHQIKLIYNVYYFFYLSTTQFKIFIIIRKDSRFIIIHFIEIEMC